MRSILVLAGIALAQEQQQAAAPADEKPAPIVCPVRGGGYDDRYAVAQLLILQKNIPQAEACLLEAVQVSLGAIALMSDIAAAQRLPLRAAAFSSVLEQLNPTDGETVYLRAPVRNSYFHDACNHRIDSTPSTRWPARWRRRCCALPARLDLPDRVAEK